MGQKDLGIGLGCLILSLLRVRGELRDCNRRKDANDGDDDHQLDQRETSGSLTHRSPKNDTDQKSAPRARFFLSTPKRSGRTFCQFGRRCGSSFRICTRIRRTRPGRRYRAPVGVPSKYLITLGGNRASSTRGLILHEINLRVSRTFRRKASPHKTVARGIGSNSSSASSRSRTNQSSH